MKILLINIFDKGYGSAYRGRVLRHTLVKMGHECVYVESNFKEYDASLGRSVSVPQSYNLFSYAIAALRRAWLAFILPYDVCIIQKALPVNILPIFSAILRKKRVILDWDDLEAYFQVSSFRKKVILWCEHLFALLPIEFTTHSSFIYDYISRLGCKSIYLLPQGIDDIFFTSADRDTARKKYNIDRTAVVFGYIATFTIGSLYDFDLVLDLYEGLEKKYENSFFAIAGGGPLSGYVDTALRKRNFKNIINVGLLNRRDMVDFLAACDAGLIAMSPGHLSNEARVSLKMLEYAASRKPIVGYACGESKRIFNECLCSDNISYDFVDKANSIVKNGFSQACMVEAFRKIFS